MSTDKPDVQELAFAAAKKLIAQNWILVHQGCSTSREEHLAATIASFIEEAVAEMREERDRAIRRLVEATAPGSIGAFARAEAAESQVAALRASQVHHVEDSGCTCRSCLLRERDALKAENERLREQCASAICYDCHEKASRHVVDGVYFHGPDGIGPGRICQASPILRAALAPVDAPSYPAGIRTAGVVRSKEWWMEKARAEEGTPAAGMLARDPVDAPRPCTCHPDDNPPKPCPQKYALSECEAAAPSPAKIVDHAFLGWSEPDMSGKVIERGGNCKLCGQPRSAHER